LYPPGEYDLVGTIVGVVNRKKIITGKTIRPGDILIGLPSSGLHTNGYSLARKIIFGQAKLGIRDTIPGTGRSVADVLLAVHRSYLKPVQRLLKRVTIRGMAISPAADSPTMCPHIAQVGQRGLRSVGLDRAAVFRFLQERGTVDRDEMYRGSIWDRHGDRGPIRR